MCVVLVSSHGGTHIFKTFENRLHVSALLRWLCRALKVYDRIAWWLSIIGVVVGKTALSALFDIEGRANQEGVENRNIKLSYVLHGDFSAAAGKANVEKKSVTL